MRKIFVSVLVLFLASCTSLRKLPQEHYYSFLYYFGRSYQNDTISFFLRNPLQCPINIKLVADSSNVDLDEFFGNITLTPLQDSVVKVNYPDFQQSHSTRYVVRYGDVNRNIEKNKIALPFPKGKEYEVIQGYNGSFTHNTLYSRYAIDFDLKIGDTITSVDHGYVVGVIEDYKDYGTSKKWLENDKSNYITLYHPHSGLFTQYVHLDYKGALVQLGDFVQKGEPIGICGMTGFTTSPHLHFNVKIPTEEHGLISTEIEFENGMSGGELRKKNRVK